MCLITNFPLYGTYILCVRSHSIEQRYTYYVHVTLLSIPQSLGSKKDSPSLPLSLWPSLDIRLENFRAVIPDSSYTNTLLLNTSSLHLSALDFPSPDVRLVTDHSAFKELARLSLEKQLPPLPLYQLDLLGVGMVALVKADWYVFTLRYVIIMMLS